MLKEIKKLFLSEDSSIRDAMGIIQREALGIGLVVDAHSRLLGAVTDGDIRRAILRGIDISSSVKSIMNSKPITANPHLSFEALKDIMMHKCVIALPIVDAHNRVIDLVHLIKSQPQYDSGSDLPGSQIEMPIKKVLVIGGLGYLGSHLVRLLLDNGYEVRALDSALYTKQGLENIISHPKLEFIEGDIRNIEVLLSAVKEVDAAIHIAAIVGDPACDIDPEFTIEVNYTATRTIAEVLLHHSIRRFIFTSSCSVYGAGSEVFTEESHLNPQSLYAKTKLESERAILGLKNPSFSPTILRLATLYGLSPRMRFDLAVNILTSKAVMEGEITIFSGKQWRPYVHVYDAARAFLLTLQAPIEKVSGEIFNVGSNEQCLQIIQLGQIIKDLIPHTSILIKEDETDERNYSVCFDKIRNTLGFSPQKTVQDGIIEIKESLEKGLIPDFKNKIYHNFNYLNELLMSCE